MLKSRIHLFAAIALMLGVCCQQAQAQRGGRSGGGGPPSPRNMPNEPVAPVRAGESGIAWYSTWQRAREEAVRSNRPILFMAAASQCGGVPGVF